MTKKDAVEYLVTKGCTEENAVAFINKYWGYEDNLPPEMYDWFYWKAINKGYIVLCQKESKATVNALIDMEMAEKLGTEKSTTFEKMLDGYFPGSNFERSKAIRKNVCLSISIESSKSLLDLAKKYTQGNMSAMVESIIKESNV